MGLLLMIGSIILALALYVIKIKLMGRVYGIDRIIWNPIILSIVIGGLILIIAVILYTSRNKIYIPAYFLVVSLVLSVMMPSPTALWFFSHQAYFEDAVEKQREQSVQYHSESTEAEAEPEVGEGLDCVNIEQNVAESCEVFWEENNLIVSFQKSFYLRLVYVESESAIKEGEDLPLYCNFDGSIIEKINKHWIVCEVDWM